MLHAQATCNQIISNKLRCYNTFSLIAKSEKLYLSPIHAHHDLIQYRTFFLDITCAYNFLKIGFVQVTFVIYCLHTHTQAEYLSAH